MKRPKFSREFKLVRERGVSVAQAGRDLDVHQNVLRNVANAKRGLYLGRSGFLGMSRETLERVYGHHHPDFLQSAAKALN